MFGSIRFFNFYIKSNIVRFTSARIHPKRLIFTGEQKNGFLAVFGDWIINLNIPQNESHEDLSNLIYFTSNFTWPDPFCRILIKKRPYLQENLYKLGLSAVLYDPINNLSIPLNGPHKDRSIAIISTTNPPFSDSH